MCPFLTLETKEGKVLYRALWEREGRFELSYTHSVNRSPITEVFTVRKGTIVLIQGRFHSFGAGVAALPEEGGGTLRVGKEYLEYAGMEREIPVLGVFVPREAQTTFRYGNEGIPLAQLAPPGSLIYIRVARKPLAWRFFMR